MKHIGLTILLFLSSCALTRHVEVPGGRLAVAQNTWKLHVPGGGHGSAVPVRCDKLETGDYAVIFLTAAHVTNVGPEMGWRVTKPGGHVAFNGLKVATHPRRDAALVMFLLDHAVPVAHISSRRVEMWETLWAIGYPSGASLNISQGIAASDRDCSAPVYPGNSGGPVVDCRGAVVGLVQSIYSASSGILIPHTMRFTRTADLTTWLRHNGIPSL